METFIDVITTFLVNQMDGEPVPPHNSAGLARLGEAVKASQQASDHDLQLLAVRTVGIVIDRVHSNIKAEQILRDFIQPGDRHA